MQPETLRHFNHLVSGSQRDRATIPEGSDLGDVATFMLGAWAMTRRQFDDIRNGDERSWGEFTSRPARYVLSCEPEVCARLIEECMRLGRRYRAEMQGGEHG
jgi:hypothetical protein